MGRARGALPAARGAHGRRGRRRRDDDDLPDRDPPRQRRAAARRPAALEDCTAADEVPVPRGVQRAWVRRLRPPAYRLVALSAAALSTLVLIGEVTLAAPLNLSPFSWTLRALDDSHRGRGSSAGWACVAFRACALAPLLYMSLCIGGCVGGTTN